MSVKKGDKKEDILRRVSGAFQNQRITKRCLLKRINMLCKYF